MQAQIVISKKVIKSNSIGLEEDLILNINYDHPKLKLSINTDMYYSYFYEGTIEDILNSNKIITHVIAEYFMAAIENITYMKIDENTALFSFPLQINYVKNTIKIECAAKTHTDQNYIIKKVSEKLTSKIVELNEKVGILEMEVRELKKHNHVEMTINFPDVPISFNEHVTSINLVSQLPVSGVHVKYSNKLTFPENLKQLSMSQGDFEKEIKFPKTLENLRMIAIPTFNYPIDFKSMTNLTELVLDGLTQFNQPIEIEKLKNLKNVKLHYLTELTYSVIIPEGVEKINIYINKCENLTIPKSVIHIGLYCTAISVKCFSERDDINTKIINQTAKLQFPKSREWFISSFISNSKIANKQISYF
jgi:hypothetical protein